MFDKICGKTVSVKSLNIDVTDIVTVTMTYTADGSEPCVVEFRNVSSLSIKDMSFPFEISALEILDYTDRGYQRDKRFFVNDYEEGKISFFCEEVEINKK